MQSSHIHTTRNTLTTVQAFGFWVYWLCCCISSSAKHLGYSLSLFMLSAFPNVMSHTAHAALLQPIGADQIYPGQGDDTDNGICCVYSGVPGKRREIIIIPLPFLANMPAILHTTHYTLHTTHYTLHTTHYTLHTTHYTLLNIQPYTLHTGASLVSDGFAKGNAYYFNYHHSAADTITALNYDGLRLSVAAYAVLAYVTADIPQDLQSI